MTTPVLPPSLSLQPGRTRPAMPLWLFWGLMSSLLFGCSLPPMPERTASHSLSPEASAQTPLGQAISPLHSAHPNLTGIHPLQDAYDAYAARAVLARTAQKTLDVQYYIWRDDITGQLLLDELLNAADRGVRVRLLLDDGGTSGLDNLLTALDQHPHFEVRLFNPFVLRTPKFLGYVTEFSRTQRRMHNKGFTADSQASIIGGRNIGDEYFAATDGVLFSDLDVLAVGSAVRDISLEFDRYWNSVSAYPVSALLPALPEEAVQKSYDSLHYQVKRPESRAYVKAVELNHFQKDLFSGALPLTWAPAVLVSDDPGKVLRKAAPKKLILAQMQPAIGEAQKTLEIISPYFVPTQAGVDYLNNLRAQGVQVRILTNGLEATDVSVVHSGYAKYRRPLLKAGVSIYEMRADLELMPQSSQARALAAAMAEAEPSSESKASPTSKIAGSSGIGSSGASLHAKTFAVDGKRLFVGSYNFDPRSAFLNTELGLVIEHEGLAQSVTQSLDRLLPRMAYKVELDGDGNLQWSGENPQAPHEAQQFSTEPGSTWIKRIWLRMLGWLPIEGML